MTDTSLNATHRTAARALALHAALVALGVRPEYAAGLVPGAMDRLADPDDDTDGTPNSEAETGAIAALAEQLRAATPAAFVSDEPAYDPVAAGRERAAAEKRARDDNALAFT